ncbi:hypothetical protein VTK73DRAFT_5993 [Phialemonium thermophilum]|uniref:Uncharacterized protein n=1 Tax=Phialemonium thermophilum TaxID=223376 RepID=A0ABR3WL41_9PEZI
MPSSAEPAPPFSYQSEPARPESDGFQSQDRDHKGDSYPPSSRPDSNLFQSHHHHEHKGELASPPSRQFPVPYSEEQYFRWPYYRSLFQDAFSEFFGVMILVVFGDGAGAQVTLSDKQKGDYQSIAWGWAIGVTLGFYVARKSGGHVNPAITLANCVYRRFPWRRFPVYLVAQFLGGMVGAAIVYGNYRSAIDHFEGGRGIRTVTGDTATASIFATYPQPFMTRTGMFFSEFINSAILQFVIFALLDNGMGEFFPLALFLLIFGIGAAWGYETGYAINLARDFGPRLVSYMIGYGPQVWSAGGYYFWIPIVAPFCGTLFGGFLYDVFLYTGRESPMNTAYMGFTRFLKPRRSVWSNTYANERERGSNA